MDNAEKNSATFAMAQSVESKYIVNHVDSGLPRSLIEVAFICYLLQAVCNWSPLMHWMEGHASWALAIIQTFGELVMYFGLLRGMKPLYRPMTVAWWIVIALNIAGFVTVMIPAIFYRSASRRVTNGSLFATWMFDRNLLSRTFEASGHLDGALYTHLQHCSCVDFPVVPVRLVDWQSVLRNPNYRCYHHLCLGATSSPCE